MVAAFQVSVPAPDMVPVSVIVAAPVVMSWAFAITVPEKVIEAFARINPVSEVTVAKPVPLAGPTRDTSPFAVSVPEPMITFAEPTVPPVTVNASVVKFSAVPEKSILERPPPAVEEPVIAVVPETESRPLGLFVAVIVAVPVLVVAGMVIASGLKSALPCKVTT